MINKRAGGIGLISGRKAFQRPMAEGVELLNAIQDVYLDERSPSPDGRAPPASPTSDQRTGRREAGPYARSWSSDALGMTAPVCVQ